MFAAAALVRGPAPGVYTIITPQPGAAAWLQNRMAANIQRELERVIDAPAAVSFTCPAQAEPTVIV